MVKIPIIKSTPSKAISTSKSVLINDLNDYLLKKQKPREPGYIIHPSTIYQCPRCIAFEMLGCRAEKVSAKTQRIFDNGTMMHLRYQKYFEEMQLIKRTGDQQLMKEWVVQNPKYWFQGAVDAILNIANTDYILELKSINSNQFNILIEPFLRHKMQACIYMFCSGVHKTLFLYENKDTQEIKEFIYPFDETLLSQLLIKVKHIQMCLKNGVLPRKECTYNLKYKLCKFGGLCEDEREGQRVFTACKAEIDRCMPQVSWP
jgi:hypothetical protein